MFQGFSHGFGFSLHFIFLLSFSQGFSFYVSLHHFVLDKLATSIIMVKTCVLEKHLGEIVDPDRVFNSQSNISQTIEFIEI